MAQFQQKDNQGVLFNNTKKTQPNHPDFTGKITVEGKEFELSAWKKHSEKSQSEYLSVAIREPRQQGNY